MIDTNLVKPLLKEIEIPNLSTGLPNCSQIDSRPRRVPSVSDAHVFGAWFLDGLPKC